MRPLVTVDNPAVVIESVKLAEDRSGDVIVCSMSHLAAEPRPSWHSTSTRRGIIETDLMEATLQNALAVVATNGIATDGASATISVRPFQLVMLRIRSD